MIDPLTLFLAIVAAFAVFGLGYLVHRVNRG